MLSYFRVFMQIVIAVFCLFLIGCCKKFIKYQGTTLKIEGLSSELKDSVNFDIGTLSFNTEKYREASEKIQLLDLQQFEICQTLHSMKSGPEKEKLKAQRVKVLLEIYKVTSHPDDPNTKNAERLYSDSDKLSTDLNGYMFAAEIVVERYEKNLTSKESLEDAVLKLYNPAIKKLREREYANIAFFRRSYDKEAVNDFKKIMEKVKKIDSLIHEFNPEAEKIASGVQSKADPRITKPILEKISPVLKELQTKVHSFLSERIQ